MSDSGTLRIWKIPALTTSTRKKAFSPSFAFTVMVNATSNRPSPTAFAALWICTSMLGVSRSRNTCGAFGTSMDKSLT